MVRETDGCEQCSRMLGDVSLPFARKWLNLKGVNINLAHLLRRTPAPMKTFCPRLNKIDAALMNVAGGPPRC